ncbi:hypothetical protein CBR_g5699 [Chara braunii]|uniref:FAM91 N-terminal domain-containing protein n=1 Tax=Chara braunii TaxID=69332 RepID=A0A388JRT5_CHABU|nr:hypothetical protein CBR_g5699 [Chara braunii]|eukprot:GBG60524.1 hypothetical protein CBR_g5699 [Chara braunii]
MDRAAASNEEGMVAKAIEEEMMWEFLPKRLKLYLSSSEEWSKRVKEHFIKKRLRWGEFLGRLGCREMEYYEDLVRYLRKNQALYPYHLSDITCRIMRISPFRYYCELLYEVMKHERSYDTIPNFSAADALRLTGIGRNEFIDIMNKCRAKKLMWKINKSILKEHLPSAPVDFNIDSWWNVCVVNISNEEYRKLAEEELAVLEKVVKEGASLVGELDLDIVRRLYRRGLVYYDVPVYSADRFQVSTLEGFVSNRDQSYEDPTEELLYQVFVASSEHATVAELAGTLQADLLQLEAAVSLACRLGYARKIFDPSNFLTKDGGVPGSPNSADSVGEDGGQGMMGYPGSLHDEMMDGLSPEHMAHMFGSYGDLAGLGRNLTRFALMVDANLTSYLMMGSLSPGLKRHAVTLFEAGKLNDASVTEIIDELQGIEGQKLEGELQRFADHAVSLRHVLQCLQQGGQAWDLPKSAGTEEKEGDVAVEAGGERLAEVPRGEGMEADASGLSAGGFLSVREDRASDSASNGTGVDGAGGNPSDKGEVELAEDEWQGWYEGPTKPERRWHVRAGDKDMVGDGNGKQVGARASEGAEEAGADYGAQKRSTPGDDTECGTGDSLGMGVDLGRGESGEYVGSSQWKVGGPLRHQRLRCPVDMLRCESLAGLPPATLQRVMKRDYTVVVSMVPLMAAPPMVSSEGMGPVHFGPPSGAAVSPWMKLLLYAVAGSGPVTVALVQGQRLRVLPTALADCDKAIVWSWDGESLGGVGGKGEGTLVNGSILLHVLNSLLRQSAVLVQPLWEEDLGVGSKPETADLPLPLLEGSEGEADIRETAHPYSPWRGASVGGKDTSQGGGSEEGKDVELHKLPAVIQSVNELELRTVGYIRMMKVSKQLANYGGGGGQQMSRWDRPAVWVPQSVEFGVPLFKTELCKSVCEGAIRACLFDSAALERHRTAMMNLRVKLRDFISDYRAGGPIATAAYLGLPQQEWCGSGVSFACDRRSRLGSLDDFSVSGRLSPIASPRYVSGEQRGASGEQRPHRRLRSEVASFDSSDPSFSLCHLASSQDSLKNFLRGGSGGSTPPRVFQAPHRVVEDTLRSEDGTPGTTGQPGGPGAAGGVGGAVVEDEEEEVVLPGSTPPRVFQAPHRVVEDTLRSEDGTPGTTGQPGGPGAAGGVGGAVVEDEEEEVVLPGVNLLFDGSQLLPLDVSTCLQGRLPASLVAEVAFASGLITLENSEGTVSSARGSVSVAYVSSTS